MSCWTRVCHISSLLAPPEAFKFSLRSGQAAFAFRASSDCIGAPVERAYVDMCAHQEVSLLDGPPQQRFKLPPVAGRDEDLGSVAIKVLHPDSNAKAQREKRAIGLGEGEGDKEQALVEKGRRPAIKWLEFSSAKDSFFTDVAVPESAGGGSDLYSKTVFIHCKSHGAVFDLDTGLCIAGPCQGRSLLLLESEVRGDELFVKEPDAAAMACA